MLSNSRGPAGAIAAFPQDQALKGGAVVITVFRELYTRKDLVVLKGGHRGRKGEKGKPRVGEDGWGQTRNKEELEREKRALGIFIIS